MITFLLHVAENLAKAGLHTFQLAAGDGPAGGDIPAGEHEESLQLSGLVSVYTDMTGLGCYSIEKQLIVVFTVLADTISVNQVENTSDDCADKKCNLVKLVCLLVNKEVKPLAKCASTILFGLPILNLTVSSD